MIMLAATNPYSSQAYTPTQKNIPSRIGEESDNRPKAPFSTDQQEDTVILSPEGQNFSRNSSPSTINDQSEEVHSLEEKGSDQHPLTEEELKQLTELKRRDTEVRAHEQAHLAAAGQYAAGGASFSYQSGPDGKRYAVGGEVPIDIGKESSPEATILKMRTVKRAALAPANPSSADRSIAASATAKEAQAMKEILSNSGENSSKEPATELEQDGIAPSDNLSGIQEKNSPPAPISEFNRRIMNAAYLNMAGLTA